MHLSKDLLDHHKADIDDWRAFTDLFMRSHFFNSPERFALKVLGLRCAFAKMITGVVQFEFGGGKNGKGADEHHDFNLLGAANCATMDCTCFMDRVGF